MAEDMRARYAGFHGPKSRLAIEHCSGGEEAHMEHLQVNQECPWCGAFLNDLAQRLGLQIPWTVENNCQCEACRQQKKEGKSE